MTDQDDDITAKIAKDLGLPVVKGEVIAHDNSFQVEFGDVIVTIKYPAHVQRDDIEGFAQTIAHLPEMLEQFSADIANANDDFDRLLLTLKIVVSLFVKKIDADSASINMTVSEDTQEQGGWNEDTN